MGVVFYAEHAFVLSEFLLITSDPFSLGNQASDARLPITPDCVEAECAFLVDLYGSLTILKKDISSLDTSIDVKKHV